MSFLTKLSHTIKYDCRVPCPETNAIITTKWEAVGTNMAYLLIDEELTMKQQPYPERTQLYKELYDKYYSKKFGMENQ